MDRHPLASVARAAEGSKMSKKKSAFVDYSKPDCPELDALVAEKIFGGKYRSYGNGGGEWKYPSGLVVHSIPHYSTDASADYLVLQAVLKWPYFKRSGFATALDKLLRVPLSDGCVEVYPNAAMRYQPGFYSRAALAVLESAEVRRIFFV